MARRVSTSTSAVSVLIAWCSCTQWGTTANEGISGSLQQQVVFKHGDGGLWCARQAGLVKAGGQRVLAFTELWNYTGNFCFLKTGPPPEINDYGLFQEVAYRISDDNGATWGPLKLLPTQTVVWNPQVVYFPPGPTDPNGTVLVHVKDKVTGGILQVASSDRGDTWGAAVNISSFFPRNLLALDGLRPSYGHGIVVPSAFNRRGRLLMTGYDRFFRGGGNTSCHVYTSDDGGLTWNLTASIPRAFECQVSSMGGHDVYLNARHMRDPSAKAAPATPVPRLQASSHHDGANFTLNASMGWLYDPDQNGVYGSTVAMSGGSQLFFVIAAGPATSPLQPMSETNSGRNNLVLHRSVNGGRTWDARVIAGGVAGYNDMVQLSNDTLGIMWETEAEGDTTCSGACALVFLEVNVSALFPVL